MQVGLLLNFFIFLFRYFYFSCWAATSFLQKDFDERTSIMTSICIYIYIYLYWYVCVCV
jgi:hypothetical protein